MRGQAISSTNITSMLTSLPSAAPTFHTHDSAMSSEIISSIITVSSCISWLASLVFKNLNAYQHMMEAHYHIEGYKHSYDQQNYSILLYRYQLLVKLAVKGLLIDSILAERVAENFLIQHIREQFVDTDAALLNNLETSINTTLGLIKSHSWYARSYLMLSLACSMLAIAFTLNNSIQFSANEHVNIFILISVFLVIVVMSLVSMFSKNAMLFPAPLRSTIRQEMAAIETIELKMATLLFGLGAQMGDVSYQELITSFNTLIAQTNPNLPPLLPTSTLLVDRTSYGQVLPPNTVVNFKTTHFSNNIGTVFKQCVISVSAQVLKQDYDFCLKNTQDAFSSLSNLIKQYKDMPGIGKFNASQLPELLKKLNTYLSIIEQKLKPGNISRVQRQSLKTLRSAIDRFQEAITNLQLRQEEYNKDQPVQFRL